MSQEIVEKIQAQQSLLEFSKKIKQLQTLVATIEFKYQRKPNTSI